MKKLTLIAVAVALFIACGESPKLPANTDQANPGTGAFEKETDKEHEAKGIGKFTNVELASPLNQEWVKTGQSVYDLKCLSCHKLTDEKLVGPGWKDVTKRRKAEWVMNFVTNVDEMLSKDAESIAMLEECLVRMPNQNLSDDDARAVYEFMRHNDGEK